MTKIALFGLGEAGSLIGADITRLQSSKINEGSGTASSIKVVGFDPAEVKTPDGVLRVSSAREAVHDANYVFALTGSVDAKTALTQALNHIPTDAVYADFASASAGLKRELADIANNAGFAFCDVALMAMVPGNGIKTPCMLSGNGATQVAALLTEFSTPVAVVSENAGDAAQRKLLRSVVIKGLAGLLIESLEASHQAGCEQWLWDNLVNEFTKMDAAMLQRLVQGTGVHAERRFHEMEASANQLIELGVEPLMTRSTVANLAKVRQHGVPEVPKQ